MPLTPPDAIAPFPWPVGPVGRTALKASDTTLPDLPRPLGTIPVHVLTQGGGQSAGRGRTGCGLGVKKWSVPRWMGGAGRRGKRRGTCCRAFGVDGPGGVGGCMEPEAKRVAPEQQPNASLFAGLPDLTSDARADPVFSGGPLSPVRDGAAYLPRRHVQTTSVGIPDCERARCHGRR